CNTPVTRFLVIAARIPGNFYPRTFGKPSPLSSIQKKKVPTDPRTFKKYKKKKRNFVVISHNTRNPKQIDKKPQKNYSNQ
ncbi:hypothetical protein, partial [Bacteroides fragilis]|uniref:hypothetical protein n=1 Tax=Bacteroides fragilis TaxID=817 RepID=UPI001FB9D9EA